MPALLSPMPKQRFFTNANLPAAGYTLTTYVANTGTLLATYSDRAGTIQNPNPLTLDANGECVMYLTSGQVYDFQLKRPDGSQEWLREDIEADPLASDLASYASGKGARLVFPSIDVLPGVDPTGVALSDTGFAIAAALGTTIKLTPNATYYLSQPIAGLTNGSRFECDGVCTIKLKTGSGGFNNTNFGGAFKDANSVFLWNGKDDFGVKGVRFTTDGVKEVTIYPIRVYAGTSVKGCDFERITFKGLSCIAGGYLSLNSIGDGGYRWRDISAYDCGTAQGSTYWTGTPQITVIEVDNDMVGGVASFPGYGSNLRVQNVLLTGAAKTAWGQQTDALNIAGVSGTDRKGPTIHGVYADGVGEVCDLFCTGATITGIRAKNVHMFVAKFIHGARHNHVEVDVVESSGLAVVTFAGSSSLAVHTEYNTCKVRTCKGLGDAGDGPTTANTALVLVQENGGTLATCLPRNNVCEITQAVGGTNLDYIVRDNCSVDNANNNIVRVTRASGFQLGFCSVAFPANCRARYLSAQPARLSIGTTQPVAAGATATVQYQTVQSDADSLATIASYKITPKFPGWYKVHAQVRVSGNAAADTATIRLKRNGSSFAQSSKGYGTGSIEICFDIAQDIYIGEDQAGTVQADLTVEFSHNSGTATTASLLNTSSMSYFEVAAVVG